MSRNQISTLNFTVLWPSDTSVQSFVDCIAKINTEGKFFTRKSSCVNSRGTPTAAYQVLHLFPEVWYPPGRVPPQPGLMGGYLRWGTPQAGVPPWPGLIGGIQGRVPPRRGTPSHWQGTPSPRQGYPPSGPGWGTPLGVDRQMDGWMDRHV